MVEGAMLARRNMGSSHVMVNNTHCDGSCCNVTFIQFNVILRLLSYTVKFLLAKK
jgi:hypothetical protein